MYTGPLRPASEFHNSNRRLQQLTEISEAAAPNSSAVEEGEPLE